MDNKSCVKLITKIMNVNLGKAVIVDYDDDTLTLEVKCTVCGRVHRLSITWDEYYKRVDGELIQNAFPNMPAADRELIITGICGKCWEAMYNFYSDEEEECVED